jgi:hypothetical protein
MDEKQLQALFDAMGTQLGLDDYKSFKSNIYSDPKFRKAFFDEASQDLDLGDYNSLVIFFKKKLVAQYLKSHRQHQRYLHQYLY